MAFLDFWHLSKLRKTWWKYEGVIKKYIYNVIKEEDIIEPVSLNASGIPLVAWRMQEISQVCLEYGVYMPRAFFLDKYI